MRSKTEKRKLVQAVPEVNLEEPAKKSPYFSAPASSVSTQERGSKVGASKENEADCQNMTSLTKRIGRTFFNKPCIELAKSLLGQLFVRMIDGERVTGRIVETEAYVGAEDSASHTYRGRQSASNKSMFLNPGHAYIYFTYGMYHCINITSQGEGQAVLLRALVPIEGAGTMRKLRQAASKRAGREFKDKDLCNGPGKLCLALDINRTLDGTDLADNDSPEMWIEGSDPISNANTVSCPRIGIDSATKEWVEKPLRFYVKGDLCVSKRNKQAEEECVSL